ncbi:hypothetical protein [Tunturiibacter gelidiferens]|uniref:hypothetical protein n=1 Tax=Tunturiibacter gelidiferens TaxID=3069689 RepID=UPI003D9BF4AE
MPAVIGSGLAEVIPGRGAAFGDLFNDGKTDVVINSMDHVPSLMRDVSPDHHHWVGFKLIGGRRVRGMLWGLRCIWLRTERVSERMY